MAAQDLCTLSDVRATLELPAADTSRDALIATLITQASDAIMNEVDREFAPATASATRRFRIDGLAVNLAPYDLRTAATVTLNPEGTSPQVLVANTDYELTPIGSPSGTFTSLRLSALLSSLFSPHAFSFGHAMVDVSGAWGFASVPTDVVRACVITVASWLTKDVAALVAAGELDLMGGVATSFPSTMALPKVALERLGPYYRLSSLVPA